MIAVQHNFVQLLSHAAFLVTFLSAESSVSPKPVHCAPNQETRMLFGVDKPHGVASTTTKPVLVSRSFPFDEGGGGLSRADLPFLTRRQEGRYTLFDTHVVLQSSEKLWEGAWINFVTTGFVFFLFFFFGSVEKTRFFTECFSFGLRSIMARTTTNEGRQECPEFQVRVKTS